MRALIECRENAPEFGIPVPVDLGALIARVFVAPTENQWFVDAVAGVVREFGLDCVVAQSDLYRGPVV